ncbi:MAG: P1 family peptidase [Gemmatimonadota bacterium]|nr:MAG: P1 family peptidase [Gemmatimonadota bacterium]
MTFLLLFVLNVVGQERLSAREIGVVVGIMPPGPLNAITDVEGVMVGHKTVASGDSINTGVTAILPHNGNVFQDKVPAAVVMGNAFGKLFGSTQIQELGELESPIVLTCTLCVPRAADAVLTYLLSLPGNEEVRSANPVVGETNDAYLNNIRLRPISEADVLQAIDGARGGPVEQGSVGAGRGTMAFAWKGGIGTSSRKLPEELGGWTVGVLVQSNYGGVLEINGAPVGREIGYYYYNHFFPPETRKDDGEVRTEGYEKDAIEVVLKGTDDQSAGPLNPRSWNHRAGSIMIVVATDAPLSPRNLERLGRRALAGVARTGSSFGNGSGDFVVAFSTVRLSQIEASGTVSNNSVSPLFHAVIEATEEAIYNSMFLATTVRGYEGNVRALPLDRTLEILKRYGVVEP